MAMICMGCGCIPRPNDVRWYFTGNGKGYKALCGRCADKGKHLPKETE